MVAATAAVAAAEAAVAGIDAGPGAMGWGAEYKPDRLLLQWHLTDRCNLRCAHCYQESYRGPELSFPEWLEILDQFKTLLTGRGEHSGLARRAHITVTGGEPLVRSDFFDLVEVLAAQREWSSFAILTNGTLIDIPTAGFFRQWGVSFVQVSIEGSRKTHDQIRGPGSYEGAVAGIQSLVAAGVRTLIAFTANRSNFREFPEVAQLGRQLGVSQVWADRLVPLGTGSDLGEQVLTPQDTREFFEILRQSRDAAGRDRPSGTRVTMHRALQFLAGGEFPYQCTAGDSLLTLMPNGDLYPCRRMPIRVGNLFQAPLKDLYHNEILVALRDRSRVNTGCQGCLYARLCRGGLRCLAYALTRDPFQKDPGCWHSFP